MLHRFLVVLLLTGAAMLNAAGPAAAECTIFNANCDANATGVDIYGRAELAKMAAEYAKQRASAGPRYEYKTVDACGPGGSKAGQEDCITNRITLICPGLDGPLVDIFRRTVSAAGVEIDPWSRVGMTCLPNEVPGAAKRPTMAMIIDAFHHTSWAKASIGFQPKGYLTLVNLPSYYEANWSSAGYGPGEVDAVDPAAMFGHGVSIRPRLVSFTYHFGDGSAEGPTTSTGGVYPSGDVRHTYLKPGVFRAYVTVVWGADFRVDTGPWQPIPATASVDQAGQPITVKEAHARLVQ